MPTRSSFDRLWTGECTQTSEARNGSEPRNRNSPRFLVWTSPILRHLAISSLSEVLSTAFRNYGDVLIWTSHGDTETQRRSTRAACTAGRVVRRANRKRTTGPRSSGRSFAVGTPRAPLRGAASSALREAGSSLCLCVSVAKYVVVFLNAGTDRRHEIRHRNCEIEYLGSRCLPAADTVSGVLSVSLCLGGQRCRRISECGHRSPS